MSKKIPSILTLIRIGNDAQEGKICQHCGREFKKVTGYPRVCSKCKKE